MRLADAAVLASFASRLASFFSGTLFGFDALFFLALQFFLGLLERDTHEASSQIR